MPRVLFLMCQMPDLSSRIDFDTSLTISKFCAPKIPIKYTFLLPSFSPPPPVSPLSSSPLSCNLSLKLPSLHPCPLTAPCPFLRSLSLSPLSISPLALSLPSPSFSLPPLLPSSLLPFFHPLTYSLQEKKSNRTNFFSLYLQISDRDITSRGTTLDS